MNLIPAQPGWTLRLANTNHHRAIVAWEITPGCLIPWFVDGDRAIPIPLGAGHKIVPPVSQ